MKVDCARVGVGAIMMMEGNEDGGEVGGSGVMEKVGKFVDKSSSLCL